MAAPKTRPTDADVDAYLASIDHPQRRTDTQAVVQLMREITATEPVMWGTMIGFGRLPYTNARGETHVWFAIGVAPRTAALTLYGLTYDGSNDDLIERLGKHKTGKGCLYVNKLADIDLDVLRELIVRGWLANHQPEAASD